MPALARQEKNEELVLRGARVSEVDLEAMRCEFEQRLAASERKVYALTKERDALRRGSEKLSTANDLVKEKDQIISQVGWSPTQCLARLLRMAIVLQKRNRCAAAYPWVEALRFHLSAGGSCVAQAAPLSTST